MCGRYTLSTPGDVVARHFKLKEQAKIDARYNAAPTQEMPVIRQRAEGGERSLDRLRWGLVPFWADDPSIGSRMINARAETVSEKPAFRASFKRRRCLVPADGFYEWRKEAGGKQPYLVRLRGGELFAFAGLWSRWDKGEGEPLETFTLLTTKPNPLVAKLHDRMPVILPVDRYDLWLSPELEAKEELLPVLGPFPADRMESYPVSPQVNRVRNDGPELIRPLDESGPG